MNDTDQECRKVYDGAIVLEVEDPRLTALTAEKRERATHDQA